MSTRTPAKNEKADKDEKAERDRRIEWEERRRERLSRMTPENRELCESIRRLREEIGPIGFSLVEFIRKLRNNA